MAVKGWEARLSLHRTRLLAQPSIAGCFVILLMDVLRKALRTHRPTGGKAFPSLPASKEDATSTLFQGRWRAAPDEVMFDWQRINILRFMICQTGAISFDFPDDCTGDGFLSGWICCKAQHDI